MVAICEILTADPEGGAARIPYPLFQELYRYLAEVDGEISQEHTKTVYGYLAYYVYVINQSSYLDALKIQNRKHDVLNNCV